MFQNSHYRLVGAVEFDKESTFGNVSFSNVNLKIETIQNLLLNSKQTKWAEGDF